MPVLGVSAFEQVPLATLFKQDLTDDTTTASPIQLSFNDI
jgi:hypothetical protein